MQKKRALSLNIKLLASVLAVILFFSLVHLVSYARLLATIVQDTKYNANERLTSATVRLDANFDQLFNDYIALSFTPAFRKAVQDADLSVWDLTDLKNQASAYFDRRPAIAAYAIFFEERPQTVTTFGVYDDADFFFREFSNDHYDADFWYSQMGSSFSRKLFPATEFCRQSPFAHSCTSSLLMPIAFKPYWDRGMMVMLLVDIEALCSQADLYLDDNFYIFNEAGEPLLKLDSRDRLDELPPNLDPVYEYQDGYISQRHSSFGDLTYIKLLDKSALMGQLTNSIRISLFTSFAAGLLGLALAAVVIRRLTSPVQEILHMVEPNETDPPAVDELHHIQNSVRQMVDQRDQYVEQLSRKDEALSGFLFQSQLKNIVVDLDAPEDTESVSSRSIYILYFRARYRSGILQSISYTPETVSYLLQQILNDELCKQFDSALIFQLEPNQFVAKVSLRTGENPNSRMDHLVSRLENESDFAFFTLVQSAELHADDNFTEVYSQILDAAPYAWVNGHTQLLRLPLDLTDPGGWSFPEDQAQQLRILIREGRAEEARALTDQILENNLSSGIRYAHLTLLCTSIINLAMRALPGIGSGQMIQQLNSGETFNRLRRCDISADFRKLVEDFVERTALYSLTMDETTSSDYILSGIRAFLAENYQRDFSMDELADQMHLSKNYLSGYFKDKTGTNLSDHIQFFRIQKAVELLDDHSLKIKDISNLVGIPNINTFLRQFKKYTGMTPREYRTQKNAPQ